MVEVSKLLAVVGATHQIPPAATVTIMITPVPGSVTIALTLVTRILRSAASPVLHLKGYLVMEVNLN